MRFAILDGFGPIVSLGRSDRAGGRAQRFDPLGLASLTQPVDVGSGFFQPLRRQNFQLLDNSVDRAHRD